MDTPAPTPAPPTALPRAALFLLVAGFIGYGVFLASHAASFASGSDASGYFNSARLLSEGRFYAPMRVPAGHGHMEFGPMAFQPLGFIYDENAPRMAPTYPTGLPLHLLVASGLGGWRHAATIVNIFTALGSGLLLWGFARRLQLTPGWAALGLALLWLCPLSLYASLQPMGDQLALFWSLATLYAALRSREDWRWSLLAGVACSLAVLVRATDVLLALPLLLALGVDYRRYLGLLLGGLPGGAFFCYYNWRLYGSPLATGYGDVSTAFSRDFVPHNLAHYALWIPALLTPLVVAALAAPFVRAARRRELAVLGLWVVLLLGFYAFYYHTGETWWYLRFILPAFPILILAALVVLQSWWARLASPLWGRVVLGLALVFGVVWQVKLTRQLTVLDIPVGEAHYLHAANWARANLPPESAICCMQVSGALYFYTPFMLIRYDQTLVAKMPALFAALRDEKRPVYAALYEFETKEALERMGGHWKKISTVGNTTFWQLESAPVAP